MTYFLQPALLRENLNRRRVFPGLRRYSLDYRAAPVKIIHALKWCKQKRRWVGLASARYYCSAKLAGFGSALPCLPLPFSEHPRTGSLFASDFFLKAGV